MFIKNFRSTFKHLHAWVEHTFLQGIAGFNSRFDLLTRALLGGGRLNAPPSGFSRIAKKRRRAAPPGLHPPYPPSFPQLL